MKVTGSVTINLADEAPKIIDGYWHEFINGEWINTGIRGEGTSGLSLSLSSNYYAFKVDSNGAAFNKTLAVYIFAYKDGNKINIQASDISVSGFVPYGMTVNKSVNQITISVGPNFHPLSSGEGIEIHVVVDGMTRPLYFNYGSYKDGEDGTPGRGVASIFEQYYLSNSSTTQTGGSWTNSIPTWVAGKYIWSSSFVTYTDNTTERVAITLVPSLSGTSIVSVDVEYAKSQSPSVKPSSGWSTNAPLAEKGWYIWSRTKIVYSNSSTPIYTNEVCISGHDGSDGEKGDSVIVRYMRAENRPATPTTGVLNPSGWMSEIDNPLNGDIYWPGYSGEWTKQSNGEYKSKTIGHNENSPLRFVFFNRTAGSSIKITVRTSSESYDKLYVGKLDEGFGENYDNARVSFGGTQSQELTYVLPAKGEHYILLDYKKDVSVSSGNDAAYLKVELPIQSVWMTTCNVVNGVATAWSTPVLFIDNRIEETIAQTDRSKAITDKFGTTVDGGLIQTVMMLLREANSETITAGISAIQGLNKDRPSFWSGGTHEQALGLVTYLRKVAEGVTPTANEFFNLAPVTILHDGSAKVGSFLVERTGRIMLVNPITGKPRLVFNSTETPLISDLVGGVSDGQTINVGSGSTATTMSLSGSTVVKDGATAVFSGATISVNGSGRASDNNGMSSFVEASLVMYRSGSVYMRLGSALAFFTNQSGSLLEMDMTVIPQITFPPLPAGTYTFKLEVRKEGNVDSQSGTVTASTFQWTWSQAGVKLFQFGTNGFMAFYSNNHMHFTEDNGLDIKGATNMPGVLYAGSVASGGGISKTWGAKGVGSGSTQVSRPSVGVYNVYHTIGHTDYSVQVTPTQMSNAEVRNKYSNYFEVLMRGRAQHELQYAGFEFLVIGRNY